MEEELIPIAAEDYLEQIQDIHIDIETPGVEESIDSSTGTVSIPPLPGGKDRHLFVSYSSEDADRVWPIVDKIEKQYNMKCIYADRDFQPGMDITQNIREGFQRSWKVLLMLSPNFTSSGWCKYEREFAFVASIESGLNCIIPVKLEECEVPHTLKTITYIDATLPYCDVPDKVAQAMSKSELASFMLPFDDPKRYENGFMVDIVSKRDSLCYCRPAKHRFCLNESHTKAINESKIKLPLTMLKEAMYILNQQRAVRHYDFSANRWKLCCWSLFLLPLGFIISLLIYFGCSYSQMQRYGRFITQHGDITYSYTGNSYGVPWIQIVMGCLLCMSVCVPLGIIFIPRICQRQKFYKDAHSRMWKKLASRCLKHDTILLFTAQQNRAPTLFVVRYNIAQCQEFLACLIQDKRKDLQLDDSQAKEYAFELIVDYLSEVTPIMVTKYDTLPDASYNRHNVRKGKACICQCLEKNFN